jgi:MYXO-CTERM domain-containing protein
VAFLFGVAAHGMQDQTYDSSFMRISAERETHLDTLIDGFDTATDVFLVAATRELHAPGTFLPVDDLVPLFAALGHDVRASKIEQGQDSVRLIVVPFAQGAAEDPARVADYRARYPWAAEHLLDPTVAGSPPCQSVVVGRYWEELWRRLTGDPADSPWLAGSFPADGALGHPLGSASAEAQLVLFFARGIDATGFSADAIEVESGGARHPVEVHPWTRPMTNAVRVVPLADWAADTDYTVRVRAGLRTIDGRQLGAPIEIRFSTRAGSGTAHSPIADGGTAPDAGTVPDAGAVPDAGTAGAPAGGAAPAPAGGCSVARDPGAGIPLVLLALAILRRRSAIHAPTP